MNYLFGEKLKKTPDCLHSGVTASLRLVGSYSLDDYKLKIIKTLTTHL